MKSKNKTKIDDLQKYIEEELFPALTMNRVKKMPHLIKPLQEAMIDLNTLYNRVGRGILDCATLSHCCLAYFLDLGLDPFMLDSTSIGWSAIHVSIMRLEYASLRRLMGMAFTDSRFPGFTMHDGTTVEDLLEKLQEEAQAAFHETQTIFYTYRRFHDSAETAEEHHDYLIAALYYFLAANQMKTEVVDKEEDDYLKRFHLKKVVGDLREAVEHYYQAILITREMPVILDEFNQCLTLSAEIIDSVEPDNPEMDWEIKLGNREFFDHWRIQLEALQEWQETRRTSFSSTSSGTSAGGVEVDIKPAEETDDESAALLGAGGGLRYRK